MALNTDFTSASRPDVFFRLAFQLEAAIGRSRLANGEGDPEVGDRQVNDRAS